MTKILEEFKLNLEMSAEFSPEANLEALGMPNRGRLVVLALSETLDWRLFAGMGGRSEGSKNRYYELLEDLNGHGPYVRTAVHNPDLQKGEASTTLYVAQRQRGDWHVASNGEQTEGISIALAVGASFEAGQRLYQNEGPKADHTARVSAAANESLPWGLMGKIVRDPNDFAKSIYHVYTIGTLGEPIGPGDFQLAPGEAYYITTYCGDGSTTPSYDEPLKIKLLGGLEDGMNLLWRAWSPDIQSGLVGKEIKNGTGELQYSFRSIHPGRA